MRLSRTFLLLIGLLTTPALAQVPSSLLPFSSSSSLPDRDEDTRSGPSILPTDVCFGLTAVHFDYREDIPAPLKSTEAGWLPGAFVSLTTNRNNPFYVWLWSQVASGTIDYDGTTQTGAPRTSTSGALLFRLHLTGQYQFALSPRWSFSPLLGYAYQYWDRDIQGQGGYEEIYTWNAIILGAELGVALDTRTSLGLAARVNAMFAGHMTILLSKLAPGAEDLTFTLGTEPGVAVSLSLARQVSDKVVLFVTPFAETLAYGKSNVLSGSDGVGNHWEIHEPASRTWLVGARTGVILAF